MVQYPKTLAENLSRHPARRRILELLGTQPGTNISGLRKLLGYPWGALQHHLYMLKRAHLLESVRSGREHQYFPPGPDAEKTRRVALLRRGRVWSLVQSVLAAPGSSQSELTSGLGMSRKVMRRYVDLLKSEGLIHEVPLQKTRRYYPTDALRTTIHAAEPGKPRPASLVGTSTPAPAQSDVPEPPGF